MSKITTAAKKFEKGIVRSVVDLALEVCAAVSDTWDEIDMDTAKAEAESITADAPKASRGPRTTEWKDFVYAASECNLAQAIRKVNAGTQNLTRVKLFSLAKKLRSADSVDAAIAATFATKTAGAGRPATMGMGLGIIKNFQSRARNIVAFRKELAVLCKKHGIAY